MQARTRIVTLLATAALALAGCGGSSSSVSVVSYVKSVCSAALNWRNSIQSAGSKLSAGVNTKSLTTAKSEYVDFVSSLVTATGNAESQLKAAGSPSVSHGKQISDTLVRIFTNAHSSLTQAASQASALPTTNKRAFITAASRVVLSIRGSLARMSNITPERNSALHSAAAKDPTCRSLAGG